jgi:hypothetical protein
VIRYPASQIAGEFLRRITWSLAVGALFLSSAARALVTTDVLPPGVRAGAFVFGSSKTVTGSFGSSGERNSLVAPLNLSLSLEDLGAFQGQARDLSAVLNGLSPDQLGAKLLLTDLFSQVAVAEQHSVFGLLWGINSRFSFGVIAPIVHRRARFSFEAKVIDNSSAYANLIGNVPRLQDALQQLKEASLGTDTFANAIFTDHGYIIPGEQNFYSFGDLEFESRYRYFSSKRSDFTLRANLRLPTATHHVDLRNLLDRPVGDGTYSLKVGSVQSYKLIPGRLTLLAGLFGTLYAPATRQMGVPKTADQDLPDLTDPYQIAAVTKLHSPQFNSDVSLMLDFWKGALSFSFSHIFMLKGRDRFWGSKNLYYDFYASNTEGYEQGLEFSGEVSTIPLYLDNIFPAPGKITFAWYQPFAGKNQIIAPYGRIDFVMLF